MAIDVISGGPYRLGGSLPANNQSRNRNNEVTAQQDNPQNQARTAAGQNRIPPGQEIRPADVQNQNINSGSINQIRTDPAQNNQSVAREVQPQDVRTVGGEANNNPQIRRENFAQQNGQSELRSQLGRNEPALQRVVNASAARGQNGGAVADTTPNESTQRAERIEVARTEDRNALQQQSNATAPGARLVDNFVNRDVQIGGRINLTA